MRTDLWHVKYHHGVIRADLWHVKYHHGVVRADLWPVRFHLAVNGAWINASENLDHYSELHSKQEGKIEQNRYNGWIN
jgi:hypothetical protein